MVVMSGHRFVVEIYDTDTECIASEIGFEVADMKDLLAILRIDDFEMHAGYHLEAEDMAALNERIGLALDVGAQLAWLRWRRYWDDAPYQLHGGRELALMLAGTKPLAAFVGPHRPGEEDIGIPERVFAPHVASGRFVMRETIEPPLSDWDPPTRRVLYALPHEAWRIDAYLLLWRTAEKSGWNDGFERMQGSLLGYEDWQNDWHIAHMPELYARPAGAQEGASDDKQPQELPKG
jgi:hypothetical protein